MRLRAGLSRRGAALRLGAGGFGAVISFFAAARAEYEPVESSSFMSLTLPRFREGCSALMADDGAIVGLSRCTTTIMVERPCHEEALQTSCASASTAPFDPSGDRTTGAADAAVSARQAA